jgi:hypothetical protein
MFLFFICNEALSAIGTAVLEASSLVRFDSVLLRFFEDFFEVINTVPVWAKFAFVGSYLAFAGVLAVYMKKNKKKMLRFSRKIRQSTKLSFQLLSATSLVLLFSAGSLPMTGLLYGVEIAVMVSIAIMLITLAILLAAVAFAPKKLFVTAGACIAFVLAAACFEIAVGVIDFIEKSPQ